MKILSRNGEPIQSLAQWTRPKEKDLHWKPGRSAMELARVWCPAGGPECPTAISALLSTHEWTRDLRLDEVRPEHVTPLPERGEGRNHDLWVRGTAGSKPFILCVEAKADEPFGDTIGDTCTKALQRSEATGAVRRARALLQMTFGAEAAPDRDPWKSLRYQLLTAIAGTALQARMDGAARAALVIHEFQGSKTNKARLDRNAADLQAFLTNLNGGKPVDLSEGHFAGPWAIRTGPDSDSTVEVLVAKIVTHLSEEDVRNP